jgi:dGTPase
LDFDQLRAEVPIFDSAYQDVERLHPGGLHKLKFNEALKRILDHLVTDLIENTRRQVAAAGVQTVEDVRSAPQRLAGFSADAAGESASLKKFLNSRVYSHSAISEERDRSVAALDALFSFFLAHPDRMPSHYAEQAQNEPRHQVACDYIAGMTDHFLLRQHHELLGTAE